jgi:hypothetical protein
LKQIVPSILISKCLRKKAFAGHFTQHITNYLGIIFQTGKLYAIGGEPAQFFKASRQVIYYQFSSGLTGAWTDTGEPGRS